MQTSHASTTQVLLEAEDRDSRFLSAAVLIGRAVAVADSEITSREKGLLHSMRDRLHLSENTDELLEGLLDEGIETDKDLESVGELIEGFNEYELLHIFSFGCRMAAADGEFQKEEQALLAEFATLFALDNADKELLFAAHCGTSTIADVASEAVDELMEKLMPANLQGHSSSAYELAADNLRDVGEFANEREESNTSGTSGAEASEATNSSTEYTSRIRKELENSPLRRKLEECLKDTRSLPADIIGQERKDHLERLLATTGDSEFRIAIAGTFSSGKSTLLDALCRDADRELFPSSAVPCTGTVSILRYGDEEQFWLRDADGDEKSIDATEYRKNVTLPQEIDRTEALRDPSAEALVVERPLSLCEGGVELIDTPGLNDNPRQTQITDRYLRESDAVIYVLRADQLLTKQDREFIEGELLEYIDRENLFFVVNYFDKVKGTQEEEPVRTRTRTYFEEIYPDNFEEVYDERVHFLSAEKCLEHTSNGKSKTSYVEALDDFEKVVGNYLAEAKGEARWRRSADQLMRELVHIEQNARNAADEELTDLDRKIRERQEALEKAHSVHERLEDQKQEVFGVIQRTQEAVASDLRDELQKFSARQLPDLIEQRSEEWSTDASPIWGKSEVKEDFQEQLEEDLHDIFEEWARNNSERILRRRLVEMRDKLDQTFQTINEEMRELQRVAGGDIELPETSETGEGAFMTFMKGAGGFIAGGPAGALVGANLDIEDIAVNFAANFAVGYALALAGVGGPIVLIVGAAAVGIMQLVFGQDKIVDGIREKMVEAVIEGEEGETAPLKKIVESAEEQIEVELGKLFGELRDGIGEALDSQIEDIESQIESRIELLEQAKADKREAEQKLEKRREIADEVCRISGRLEHVSNLSFGAAKAEATGRSQKERNDSRTESRKSGAEETEIEPVPPSRVGGANNEESRSSLVIAGVLIVLVILAAGGAWVAL